MNIGAGYAMSKPQTFSLLATSPAGATLLLHEGAFPISCVCAECTTRFLSTDTSVLPTTSAYWLSLTRKAGLWSISKGRQVSFDYPRYILRPPTIFVSIVDGQGLERNERSDPAKPFTVPYHRPDLGLE